MITYADLFKVLRQDEDAPIMPRFYEFDAYNRVHKMLIHLTHAEIAAYNKETKLFSLHPKQIKPALVVLPTTPETAPIPKTVQVNWSRGFSGAKYDVLGYGISQMKDHENERYYLINNSTDEHKPMIKRVWASECRAGNETVAIVEKAA